MTEFLRVTCSCGCENRVSLDRRGNTIICVACGNELMANEQPVVPERVAVVPPPPEPAPMPAVSPRRSPFEPEDPDSGDGPPRSTSDRLDAIHRRENRARRVFIESGAVRDNFLDDRCSRCGRDLRGDWDRIETAAGVMCYVCSNQAADGIPERLKSAEAGVASRPRRRRPLSEPLPPTWRNPRWERFKRIATVTVTVLMALAVLLVTAGVSFFEWGSPRADADAAPVIIPAALSLNNLSTGAWVLARGWLIVSELLPIFVALYVVRYFSGSLEGRGFLSKLSGVALSCSPILLIQLVMLGFEEGMRGRAGGLIAVVFFSLSMLKLWTILRVFMELFEDDLGEAIAFVLVLWTINLFAMPHLNRILFQSLGLI